MIDPTYAAFDLEIAAIVPEGDEFSDYRPYGITCAALVTSRGQRKIWHPQGYGVGLDAMARGMGVEGKTEGMTGALAPIMWVQGRASDRRR